MPGAGISYGVWSVRITEFTADPSLWARAGWHAGRRARWRAVGVSLLDHYKRNGKGGEKHSENRVCKQT